MKVTTDNLRKAIGLADLIASRTVVADVPDGSDVPADIPYDLDTYSDQPYEDDSANEVPPANLPDPCEDLPFD